MSHSHALSPYPDVGRFVHDTKHDLEVASTDSETSHDPYASHRHALDFETESDEETTAHATLDGHPMSATVPNLHISPGEPSILTCGLDRKGPRVRFRSRVRISAGMGRRRRSDGHSSDTSSISGSPSSSISAPLRTHHTGNNSLGPLGSRVSLLGSQAAPLLPPSRGEYADGGKGNASGSGNGNARTRRARIMQTFLDDDVDEHTHLMPSATQHSYVRNQYVHNGYHVDVEQEWRWREQLVDEAFGKWPARLLNRHWWWWRLEPILCCFCDPDEEQG